MKKALVAYFSASGVTEQVAEKLASAAHADCFRIQPKIVYTKADLDWTNKSSRSSVEKSSRSSVEMSDPASRPEIVNEKLDILSYDAIFIGFPIWWYVAPTIINTFLESFDLSGKTIVPFATSGGSGMGKTNAGLAPSCRGAKLLDGKVFKINVTAEELANWVKSLGI